MAAFGGTESTMTKLKKDQQAEPEQADPADAQANIEAAEQYGPTGNPAQGQDYGPGPQPSPPGQEPRVAAETLGGVNPASAPPQARADAENRLAERVPGETVTETITVDRAIDGA